jgi:hypothetical protein
MLNSFNMGVEKLVIRPGNGIDFPKKHDEVSMEYTGKTGDSSDININI